MSDTTRRRPKVSSAVLRSMRRAFELANKSRHAEVTAAHLAAALLDDPEVKTAIVACGADPEELRDVALGSNDDARRRPWYRRQPKLQFMVDEILKDAAMHVLSAQLPEVSPALVLIQLLQHDDASLLVERLDAMGLESLRLKRYIAHGNPSDEPLDMTETLRSDIVIHDDPFTTREFVVESLVEAFSIPPDKASQLMLEAEREGTKVVATLDRSEARRVVTTLRGKARSAGFPLKLTLRRPGKG